MSVLWQVCGVQTISGTGALRLGMDFLFKYHASKVVYVSKPTWGMSGLQLFVEVSLAMCKVLTANIILLSICM